MSQSSSRPTLSLLALALLALSTGCDKVKATTDRALVSLQLKPACPEPVEGRAAGAESPELAIACFRKATEEGSASLLLRVTCRTRQPASCKQTDATTKEAERAMSDLKKVTWSSIIGKWNEGQDAKVVIFAIDTHPSEKKVSTITTCKIVEGDRWAVCELGEMPRDAAEQRASH